MASDNGSSPGASQHVELDLAELAPAALADPSLDTDPPRALRAAAAGLYADADLAEHVGATAAEALRAVCEHTGKSPREAMDELRRRKLRATIRLDSRRVAGAADAGEMMGAALDGLEGGGGAVLRPLGPPVHVTVTGKVALVVTAAAGAGLAVGAVIGYLVGRAVGGH
jgi:hypothetical protein